MIESYKKVNYLIRLKKQIERKILIETLQHLDPIVDIKKYCYFGFGSIYFADFILFHKYLNINKLTSIDDKKEEEPRFKFNLPYAFIDFQIATSEYFLSTKLNWEDKLLIWLDYDNPLSRTMLSDIEYVSSKAKPYDFFLISVEGDCKIPEDFKVEFQEFLSPKIKLSEIKREHPRILCNVLRSVIENSLANQTRDLAFLPLFNFEYSDSCKMYTYGGIFYENNCESIKEKVSDLSYISIENSIVEIDCPMLTPREKLFLDSQIREDGELNEGTDTKTGISTADLDKYKKYYKFYPQFFESIY